MVAGYARSFVGHLTYLYRHRVLTLELAKREILDRYAGQMMGIIWAIGHPLILVAVFVFIYQYVFGIRVGGTREMPLDYTTYLLSSLIPWMVFQEVLGKGAILMHGNAPLVKQVVFPIEVLPVKAVIASFATQCVGTACLIAWVYSKHGAVPWTYCMLPFLWGCQFLMMSGICMVLAAIGAYFRDLKDFVQVFNTVGIYLMPTVYLPEWVPETFRPLLSYNPFSHLAWCYQDACYFGRFDHPWSWLIFPLLSVLAFDLGNRLFRKLKVCFGSVL
jgi:lipopolysaccharide transport system permease protein